MNVPVEKSEFDIALRLGEILGAATLVGALFSGYGVLTGGAQGTLFLAVPLAFFASFAFTIGAFASPPFVLFPVAAVVTIVITVVIARLVPDSLTRLLLQMGVFSIHAMAVWGLVVTFKIS